MPDGVHCDAVAEGLIVKDLAAFPDQDATVRALPDPPNTGGAPGLQWLLRLWTPKLQLRHPAFERARFEPKQFGCSALAAHPPSRPLEDSLNVVALYIEQQQAPFRSRG
jgi:hypothetical protein